MNTEIEKMLTEKILEAEPSLDILGADLKVLQVAKHDLTNYLRFLSHVDKETIVSTNPDIVKPLPNVDAKEMESFLTVWTGMWLKKWKQRFSLLIGQSNKTECGQPAQPAEDVGSIWSRLPNREEMIELVATVLIKNSEICGTRLMAENILKTQLREKSGLDVSDKEQLFAFLNTAFCRAHAIAATTGPMVVIRVDKTYYSM